jgi:glutamate-1-semialdehyde 2,1-aminomutase
VTPDVWCFGKVIGGGLPVGCFGASAAVMSNVAPLGPVYQAGTLSGNPLATAAGLAVLAELDAAAYQRLEATADALAVGLEEAFASAGVPAAVPRVGPLVGLFFGGPGDRDVAPPTDYESARASVSHGRYPAFFHGMLDRGIAIAPGPYEVLFPSLAHDGDDVTRTIDAAFEVARLLAA